MILVDTSVLVNYLKGGQEPKTRIFDSVLANDIPFGISAYTYQELLQGARNEKEYKALKEYLGTQKIYFLPENIRVYEKAARMYFDLGRKGITPRGSVDVLIAYTAIHHNLALLHDDHDFDSIAAVIPELKMFDPLL